MPRAGHSRIPELSLHISSLPANENVRCVHVPVRVAIAVSQFNLLNLIPGHPALSPASLCAPKATDPAVHSGRGCPHASDDLKLVSTVQYTPPRHCPMYTWPYSSTGAGSFERIFSIASLCDSASMLCFLASFGRSGSARLRSSSCRSAADYKAWRRRRRRRRRRRGEGEGGDRSGETHASHDITDRCR